MVLRFEPNTVGLRSARAVDTSLRILIFTEATVHITGKNRWAMAFFNAEQAALQQYFAAVDQDRSGQISAMELQLALAAGGLTFSLKLCTSLVRMFDASRTHQLGFAEFMQCQQFLQQTQQVFAKHDPQRAGQINLQSVQGALSELGFALDMAAGGAFYKLCESFDFSKQGLIAQDAFIAMVVQLNNSKRIFDLFDVSNTGKVSLDFNQVTWLVAQL